MDWKNITECSTNTKILLSVVVPVILLIISYLLSYKISVYEVNAWHITGDGYSYEISEQHYSGAFDIKKTWYVWLIYVLIITSFEVILWSEKLKAIVYR